jgi:hypothetical protein
VLTRQQYEGLLLFGLAKDPKELGRIVIKRIIAESPSREGVVAESIFLLLISLGYSFSCRSDCIFKPIDRVVVTNFLLYLECCCLPHLTGKELSFSITKASFVAARLVLAAILLTAK